MEYDLYVNRVVFVTDDFLIAYKDHETCTVPLKNKKTDDTLLDFVAHDYPEVLSVCGKNEWEGGALHRLDTQTAGLVVFARNNTFYEKLSAFQSSGKFVKTYIARTDGDVVLSGNISSYFRAYGPGRKMVKAESVATKADSSFLYTTRVKCLEKGIYECCISRGFRHQIRVHLASNGCPIKGDRLYNNSVSEEVMQLECVEVSWPGFSYRAR